MLPVLSLLYHPTSGSYWIGITQETSLSSKTYKGELSDFGWPTTDGIRPSVTDINTIRAAQKTSTASYALRETPHSGQLAARSPMLMAEALRSPDRALPP